VGYTAGTRETDDAGGPYFIGGFDGGAGGNRTRKCSVFAGFRGLRNRSIRMELGRFARFRTISRTNFRSFTTQSRSSETVH
jgi:hypothetical protein